MNSKVLFLTLIGSLMAKKSNPDTDKDKDKDKDKNSGDKKNNSDKDSDDDEKSDKNCTGSIISFISIGLAILANL
ncbi:hypothetical protein NUSPORA_00870 [Nucleospora cyclopteri]